MRRSSAARTAKACPSGKKGYSLPWSETQSMSVTSSACQPIRSLRSGDWFQSKLTLLSLPLTQLKGSIMNANTASDPGAATEKSKSRKLPCAITGKEYARRDLVALDALRPSLADRIRRDHPELALRCLDQQRRAWPIPDQICRRIAQS